MNSPENQANSKLRITGEAWPYLLLVLSILVIYWQVLGFEFVNYDDDIYVTQNAMVQKGLSPESVKWAFGSTYAEFWHPLTWLSHMLDIQKVDRHPGSFAHPLNERLATSLVSYINYLIKTLWPFHLSILERA